MSQKNDDFIKIEGVSKSLTGIRDIHQEIDRVTELGRNSYAGIVLADGLNQNEVAAIESSEGLRKIISENIDTNYKMHLSTISASESGQGFKVVLLISFDAKGEEKVRELMEDNDRAVKRRTKPEKEEVSADFDAASSWASSDSYQYAPVSASPDARIDEIDIDQVKKGIRAFRARGKDVAAILFVADIEYGTAARLETELGLKGELRKALKAELPDDCPMQFAEGCKVQWASGSHFKVERIDRRLLLIIALDGEQSTLDAKINDIAKENEDIRFMHPEFFPNTDSRETKRFKGLLDEMVRRVLR